MEQSGEGDVAEFQITNSGSNNYVIDARHAGIGTALYGQSDTGHGAWIRTMNANATQSALEVQQYGNGAAGRFYQSNTNSSNEALFVSTDGLGGAIDVFDTNASSTAPALRINKSGPGLAMEVLGTARVDVLEIQGGADLSEGFDISDAHAEPGMVVVIDPDNPGQLAVSRWAYDRKVAGVIAGASGVKPGMVMSQTGSIASGELPVALTGRVYCKVDARERAVEPGDLLVTSDLPGHAMVASDFERSQGAIIGKAMTSLPRGEAGLVLVLVNLQ